MVKISMIILLIAWLAEGSRIRRQGFIDLKANRCSNPRGEAGVCLPIRSCPPLVNLLVTQRQQTEVADFLRKSVCGYQGLDPKVCCPAESDTSTSNIPTVKPKTNLTPTELTPSTTAASKQTLNSVRLPATGQCGKSSAQNTRVVGGVNATLGAWPWMAALGYQSTKGGNEPVFLCAGSLITNQHVLTAAHCLANKKKLLVVRLGDLNLYEDTDGANPVDARVSRTIVHESYNPTTFTNDIALIELEQPVTFTKNIKPICLPLSRELRAKDYVARRPFIAGWGSISFAGPSSATLLELQVPVVPETECQRAFETFKTAVIDRRVICAGYLRGGKDACRGDSGGPLMDANSQDSSFYQIGVVSYGYKCAEPGFPGIYTRVTAFADWIVNKLENRA